MKRTLALTALALLLATSAQAYDCAKADANRDGVIDQKDQAQIQADMGRTDCATTTCLGDLNGDNSVNLADLAILRTALQNGCGQGN